MHGFHTYKQKTFSYKNRTVCHVTHVCLCKCIRILVHENKQNGDPVIKTLLLRVHFNLLCVITSISRVGDRMHVLLGPKSDAASPSFSPWRHKNQINFAELVLSYFGRVMSSIISYCRENTVCLIEFTVMWTTEIAIYIH